MTAPRIRVLVVDDSAFARKVLRQALTINPRIEVVGIAGDGLEALEQIAELAPDVVTLDLMMPHLDGVGVLRALAEIGSPTRVVVVSVSDEESEVVVQALQLGAVEVIRKPTALATDRLYELSGELVEKVLSAAASNRTVFLDRNPDKRRPILPKDTPTRMVVIGTSTGGPHALTRLLSDLPADFPAAVAIALHIPEDYTEALAQRLDTICALGVSEARDGAEIVPGRVVLARGGKQLRLVREGIRVVTRIDERPETALYAPSVDILFESAAAVYGSAAMGVVLTGMGDDGLRGARTLVNAGGLVLSEAEGSCVVYGMPRAIDEAGLASGSARIEEMADEIVRRL